MFFDSVVLSALIGSCCFVYVSADSDSADPVRLQVIEASNATGVIDPITGFVTGETIRNLTGIHGAENTKPQITAQSEVVSDD